MTPIRRAAPSPAARARLTGDGRARVAAPDNHARFRVATFAITLGLLAVGCSAGSPPGSGGPTGAAGVTPGTAAGPSAATQTATEWGRIWDALPPGFPVHPGAEPVESAAGPASATLTVPAKVGAAAAWWQPALERAGYSTVAVSGPLEDGSIVIDSAGARDCRVQVAITPTGSTTTVTILYGAACPFR